MSFFHEGIRKLPERWQKPSERAVAIKKIPRAFAAHTLAKRSLREVRILRELRHENIIAVLDMFTAEGTHGRDIYMVMDLMETDLHQIIHSRQALVEQHFQYFLYQLLRGLKQNHDVTAGDKHEVYFKSRKRVRRYLQI
uniref:Protein kinase domain-containing protein n=1 Tax=Heterorhabditis bacteriophora TaxID=37862 RepID=A0A1I7X382_HETBA